MLQALKDAEEYLRELDKDKNSFLDESEFFSHYEEDVAYDDEGEDDADADAEVDESA